ncbi:hypothetical protein OC842_003732 [Tilletia horrida]|uniref:Uncharacterized protein n=1 Tax=Tilletia horrida TaxID=155126 RepID=A0AAN6JJW5_9BASI|nr:hypothetical protein OC842_003732 [Tilletia horrida]
MKTSALGKMKLPAAGLSAIALIATMAQCSQLATWNSLSQPAPLILIRASEFDHLMTQALRRSVQLDALADQAAPARHLAEGMLFRRGKHSGPGETSAAGGAAGAAAKAAGDSSWSSPNAWLHKPSYRKPVASSGTSIFESTKKGSTSAKDDKDMHRVTSWLNKADSKHEAKMADQPSTSGTKPSSKEKIKPTSGGGSSWSSGSAWLHKPSFRQAFASATGKKS